MSSYKITGVRVEVRPGLTITAEVGTASEIKDLLDDLKAEGFEAALAPEKTRRPSRAASDAAVEESPVHRIETRASLAPGKLAAANILGFKDDVPQLLRPGAFSSISDATLSLLYAVEIGLKRFSVAFDDFKDLYDAQNIKSGTPLPMLMTNLRNAGYIDKKAYATDRTVSLTAKGVAKAEQVITALCVAS